MMRFSIFLLLSLVKSQKFPDYYYQDLYYDNSDTGDSEPSPNTADCSNTFRIRYEWNDLPEEEKTRWFNVMRELVQNGVYDRLTKLHYDLRFDMHGTLGFFPAHRMLLEDIETEMLKIDSSVIMPYWDWSQYNTPQEDPIWEYFERPGIGVCVEDDVVGRHTFEIPRPHCLQRGVDQEATLFKDFFIKYLYATAPSFSTFSLLAENGHGLVHHYVGGDMTNATSAPNDPLFYLHHGFMDYMMFVAHLVRGSEFFEELNFNLASWNVQALDIIDSTSLCYIYYPKGSPFSGPVGTHNYNVNNYIEVTNIFDTVSPSSLTFEACSRSTIGDICQFSNSVVQEAFSLMVEQINNGTFNIWDISSHIDEQ